MGFDGTPEAYLTYRYLDTVTPPNSPTDFDQSAGTQKNLMSLSFYCERIEGILLVLQNEVLSSFWQTCNFIGFPFFHNFRMLMNCL